MIIKRNVKATLQDVESRWISTVDFKAMVYPCIFIELIMFLPIWYTKSLESDREVILTEYARTIYIMLLHANQQKGFQSEYLMLDKQGNRMHNDAINNVLRRFCKKKNPENCEFSRF